MRVIIPDSIGSRLPPRKCSFGGCVVATREGKPYCSDHVEHNPYAKHVIGLLAQQAKDDTKAATGRRRVANVAGVTATEILQTVSERGTRTKAALCHDLNIDMTVLDSYVSALFKEGKIILGQTRRGSETVSLAG